MLYGQPFLSSAFSSAPLTSLAAFTAVVEQMCRAFTQSAAAQFVHPSTVTQTSATALQAATASEIYIGNTGVGLSSPAQQALAGSLTLTGNTIAQQSVRAQQAIAALLELSAAGAQDAAAAQQAAAVLQTFLAVVIASSSAAMQQVISGVVGAFGGFIVGRARPTTQALSGNLSFLSASAQAVQPAVQAAQSDLAFLATIDGTGTPALQSLISLSGPGGIVIQDAESAFQSSAALQTFLVSVDHAASAVSQEALVTLEFEGQIAAAHLTSFADAQAILAFLAATAGDMRPATQAASAGLSYVAAATQTARRGYAEAVADLLLELDGAIAQTAAPAIQQITALLPQLIEFERIAATVEVAPALTSSVEIAPALTATIRVRTPT